MNVGSSNGYKMSPQLSFEIKLHGFLMWASVGLLMPVAILIKRMSNTDQSGAHLRIIFYLHAITQVVALLIATAGAVMSIKYFDNSFNNNHQRIGLVFYILMWLQAFLGIFRPHRENKCRSTWFHFHWVMGIAISLLGVINVYTGLQAYNRRTSTDVRVWTVTFTVEISLLLFFYLLQEKRHYIRQQRTTMGQKHVRPTDQHMSPSCHQKEASSQPC